MKRKILIVEDNVGLSQMQKDWFSQAGYDAVTAMNETIARSLIRRTQFDLILSDVRLPEGDGISLLEWLRKEKKDIPFILTTEYVSVSDVVRTIKLGARDYLPKPVRREHLLELAEDVFRPVATVRRKEKVLFHRTSPRILQAEKFARLVAPSDMSVMILGANGTGKESIAQTIHNNSERWNMPFVAVNCGALPRELAASLFFGHEKGAFTGADSAKTGYFDMAKGGTLFLDEIGTMSYEIQSLLLRVLQENTYAPVGGRERKADVRIIAATNEDLPAAVKNGKFREDLYYRINTIPISIPALRNRKEDISLLFRKFAADFAEKYRMPPIRLTEDAVQILENYRWPGNVRELKNITEQISILEQERTVDALRLKEYLPAQNNTLPALTSNPESDHSFATEREILYKILFDMKKDMNDLKHLVYDIMQKEHTIKPEPEPSTSIVLRNLYETPQSEFLGQAPQKTISVEKNNHIEDTEAVVEESLSLEEKEKEMIVKALEKNHGKRKLAAQDLGISERTLYRKLKEYDIEI